MLARRERKKAKKTSLRCSFSNDKIEAMKQKARELSKMIGQNSKTVASEHTTPPETLTNNEHATEIDIKPSQNEFEFSQNNDDTFSGLVDDESINIPSCSKSLMERISTETIPASNSKRTHSKDLNIKYKKPKIPYLVKCDVYQEEQVDNLTSKKQDDYVLEKLFNKSGQLYTIFTSEIVNK